MENAPDCKSGELRLYEGSNPSFPSMITNKERLEEVRKFLKQEYIEQDELNILKIIPILHNKNRVSLLFWGWEIILHDDGTWNWGDTSGG